MVLFIMFYASFNTISAFGQYITTKTIADPNGDIYHTGGNIGIGTPNPEKLLHIHGYPNIPTIRLSTGIEEKSAFSWDFENNSNLFFKYGVAGIISTQMLLTTTGQLALGTEVPHESAIFHADATDKGILIPRLSDPENDIYNPVNGLLVYNTTSEAFSFYNGAEWLQITQNQDLDIYLLTETFNEHPASNITTENINTFAEIDALLINTLLYNDATGNLQSIIPNGTEGQILTINETGNYTWTFPQATAETYWLQTDNYTYLKNENDNVGIGIETPQTALHIFTQSEDFATLRLHTHAINKNSKSGTPPQPTVLVQKFWDFKSEGTKLAFNYGNYINGAYNIENKFTFTKDGFLGLGTESPETNLHIATFDETQNTTLRMQKRVNSNSGSKGEYESVWDIEIAENTLEFKHTQAELNKILPIGWTKK